MYFFIIFYYYIEKVFLYYSGDMSNSGFLTRNVPVHFKGDNDYAYGACGGAG